MKSQTIVAIIHALTEPQRQVLLDIVDGDVEGHPPATLARLASVGLVKSETVVVDGLPVIRWTVPADVAGWCCEAMAEEADG